MQEFLAKRWHSDMLEQLATGVRKHLTMREKIATGA
jgi:hypothetical protein